MLVWILRFFQMLLSWLYAPKAFWIRADSPIAKYCRFQLCEDIYFQNGCILNSNINGQCFSIRSLGCIFRSGHCFCFLRIYTKASLSRIFAKKNCWLLKITLTVVQKGNIVSVVLIQDGSILNWAGDHSLQHSGRGSAPSQRSFFVVYLSDKVWKLWSAEWFLDYLSSKKYGTITTIPLSQSWVPNFHKQFF